MKKLLERYWKPTPKLFRKIGDSLLIISTSVTTYGIVGKWATYLIIISLLTGIIGKIITNLTTDETL